MRVSVALLPSVSADLSGNVCVVVDVIRASTAMVGLFDAGCGRVYLSGSRSNAADVRRIVGDGCLLCAEQDDGSTPPGYDYEPSPVAISNLKLNGGGALLATANGTPAIRAAAQAGGDLVIVGALRNLDAVAEMAFTEAKRRGADVTIICSGQLRSSQIALEDVYCAGAIAARMSVLAGSDSLETLDSAVIAMQLADSYDSAEEVLFASMTGTRFAAMGRSDDVRLCAETNVSRHVPIFTRDASEVACPVEVLHD
jgi:2-phosphosulfolactate phosphatase